MGDNRFIHGRIEPIPGWFAEKEASKLDESAWLIEDDPDIAGSAGSSAIDPAANRIAIRSNANEAALPFAAIKLLGS